MNFSQWLAQLDASWFLDLLITVPAALLCITFHETCHGLTAYWLGDDTAKKAGRLSLNPIKHIDWVGLIMMALCHFGWAKPVPINARKFRRPKLGMAVTALVGPVSNVLLAAVAMVFLGITTAASFYKGGIWNYVNQFFEYTVLLSCGLAVFNILPIPPLDGSKVLFALLPDKAWLTLMRFEKYGMILLVVALFTHILDTPLDFLRDGLLNALLPIGILVTDFASKLFM